MPDCLLDGVVERDLTVAFTEAMDTRDVRPRSLELPESHSSNTPVFVSICPDWWLRTGITVVLCLLLAHVGSQGLKHFGGHDQQMGFERLLNLDGEGNIPAWASTILLFVASVLLMLIGAAVTQMKTRFGGHWLLLGGVFCYLSMDEASSIHETVLEFVLIRLGLSYPYGYLS